MRSPHDGTAPPAAGRRAALVRLLLWLVVAPLAGGVVVLLGTRGEDPDDTVVLRHAVLLGALLLTGLALLRRAVRSSGTERWAWGGATLLTVLGAVVTIAGDHGTAGASAVARGWVAVLLVGAVVLSPGVRRSLDRALMLALEGWALSVGPLLLLLLGLAAVSEDRGLGDAAEPVVAVWVVGDLLVLSLLVGLLRRQPAGRRGTVAPLVVSLAAVTVAETLTWRFGSTGSLDVLSDAAWTVAVVAALAAAVGDEPLFAPADPVLRRADDIASPDAPPARHESRTWLPVVVTATVVAAVAARNLSGARPEPEVVLLTLSLVGAVLAQAGILLREQSRLSQRLHETSVRFRTIVDGSADVVLVCDAGAVIAFASPAARTVLGRDPGELHGSAVTDLAHPQDRQQLVELLERGHHEPAGLESIRAERVGGGWRHVEVQVQPHDTPAVPGGLTVVLRDVSERVRLQRELERRARYDSLTGLPNRWWFSRGLAERVAQGRPTAVVFIDLDEFKAVNDTEGHAVGDRLLVAAARRLRFTVGEDDLVGRLSGDEFAVAVGDDDVVAVQAVAERILQEMSAPYSVGSRRLRVAASIGLAVARPGGGADEVLREADLAMYEAKRAGGRRVVVSHPRLLESAVARGELERRVREAADEDGFEIHHQPVVDLLDGRVVGVEALLRWPGSGVGPAEFVPFLERSTLIVDVGAWVLDRALAQAAEWDAAGHPVSVAVNLSPLQLADERLAQRVADALARHGVPPSRLTLEVTESTLLRDLDAAAAALGHVRRTGVHVALDDFGTGYSSLAHLHRLPIDVLKVDRTFLEAAVDSERDEAVLRSIVALGHELGLTVIAEGVQDAAQVRALRALGCGLAQGYLLARPTRAADVPWQVQLPPGLDDPSAEAAMRTVISHAGTGGGAT